MEKKLENQFKTVENTINKLSTLKIQMEMYLDTHKDDEVLKGYLDIVNEIQACNEEIDKAKTYLYESMLQEDIDILNGTYCDVTLKRPYDKTSVNTKKFLRDYGVDTPEYQKYVNIKQAKGNITIKPILTEGM